MTGLETVLDCYDWLNSQNLADRTVAEYGKWLRRLARWCELHDLRPADLRGHHLRQWADETIPPGRESRKNARSACRHYYTWLGRTDEPWDAIRVPRKRKTRPRPLIEDERVRVRDAAILVGGRAGLATLGILQTGARLGEVARWRWDGVDLDHLRIRWWRPKVRDHHEVPLRPALADALERLRPPYPEGFVFVGNNGRPHVSEVTVWEWVRQVATVAEVADVTPQRLRATAVSRVLEVTGSIDVAAELAGHQDVSVTRTYYAATTWARLEAGSAALD